MRRALLRGAAFFCPPGCTAPAQPAAPAGGTAATNHFFSLRNTGQKAILFIAGHRLTFTVRRIAGKAAVYRADGGRSYTGFTPQPTCWPPPLLTGRGIFIFLARKRPKPQARRAAHNVRENNIFSPRAIENCYNITYNAQDHCGKRRRI